MKDESSDPREYYKHLSLFWTDLIHLMSSKPQALGSVGPMRSFAENAKAITRELLDANEDLAGFNEALARYYSQLSEAWAEAQKKVNAKAPRIPRDPEQFEAYKRVWIDIFDNDFTELFDSKEFGENYGRLVAKELELARRWENMTNVVLKSANLPSRKEIDEVYRELHALRRRVARLEAEKRDG
ncbi:hypothetical protein CENSYa_1330 [Cenarchaeum symbiosum A]|uniref:Poly(3-hydroxyalkanoate) polymerase subunit PhaE n=1 Tax=Cenarchaeum symbiosum (strain A) TaxID=414004 RepID=A0RX86_CENSY|nr:hypothetical protein CENSYa_1330 [Cenarchaeum symbiosum A]